jgi:hypothetical protein
MVVLGNERVLGANQTPLFNVCLMMYDVHKIHYLVIKQASLCHHYTLSRSLASILLRGPIGNPIHWKSTFLDICIPCRLFQAIRTQHMQCNLDFTVEQNMMNETERIRIRVVPLNSSVNHSLQARSICQCRMTPAQSSVEENELPVIQFGSTLDRRSVVARLSLLWLN